jgi:hypothetical protein
MPPISDPRAPDGQRLPRARVVDLVGRVAAHPANSARSLLQRVGRVAVWTALWTLYQWWAVIGVPDVSAEVYASMGTGMAGLVAAVVWRDVQRARQPSAGVIPFPRGAVVTTPPEDLAA